MKSSSSDWQKVFQEEYTRFVAGKALVWIGLTVGIAALAEWLIEVIIGSHGDLYHKVCFLSVILISAINVEYLIYFWEVRRRRKPEDNRVLILLILVFGGTCIGSALFKHFSPENPELAVIDQNITLGLYILGIFVLVFLTTFMARFRINFKTERTGSKRHTR